MTKNHKSKLDGDDGGGWDEFDDSDISLSALKQIASKDYIELIDKVTMKAKLVELKELFGIDLEKEPNGGVPCHHEPFNDVSELTEYLNSIKGADNIEDAHQLLLELLNINVNRSESSWFVLELTRRDFLNRSLSSSIESNTGQISPIHHWDLSIDDDVVAIISLIDKKILAFVNYHRLENCDPLSEIKLIAEYRGPQVALDELKVLINKNNIENAEYYQEAVRLSVLCDEIAEAEEWIIKSHGLKNIPLIAHFDFMFFYMRFDDGYKMIAKYAARILPQLSKEERRSLVPFLLKQIEIGYLEKEDLTLEVIAEMALYENELN